MIITDNDTINLKNALAKIDRLEKENLKLKRLINLYTDELKVYKNQNISNHISNPALNIKTKSLSVI